ncbi:hypothetical protein [Bradyrhizobium prioriisuperbiae]|uniref:hypothetical protein n=1 Tax=Bradyrhizobium prioriisuperbiae TaxID=2854389 RepID=UPI0028EF528E|nr:hypothetical protein [Bradyrhizobium prioritasuperba]
MLGRALNLAAASLVGCLVATAAQAQNLDAGKSPGQIFNSNCAACHKSARGLLKTVSPSSLSGFLRQHYTTGSDMAQMLSGYLMANGATAADSRQGGARRGRPEAGTNLRPDAPIGSAAPEGDRAREQAQRPDSGPAGRRQRQNPDAAVQPDGTQVSGAPAEPAGMKAKQKLAKKNRKGEPPKTETKTEPAATEPTPDVAAKPEAAPEAATSAAVKDVAKERAIDAAVPVPEPVDLPPPTAADIKPSAVEAPKASADKAPADKGPTEKADTEKAGTEKSGAEKAAADPPKPPPPASPPAHGAPPSASASAVGGPPAPPISQ